MPIKVKQVEDMDADELSGHMSAEHKIPEIEGRELGYLLEDHQADHESIISQNPAKYGVPAELAPIAHVHQN